jgi:hypothetical protein
MWHAGEDVGGEIVRIEDRSEREKTVLFCRRWAGAGLAFREKLGIIT